MYKYICRFIRCRYRYLYRYRYVYIDHPPWVRAAPDGGGGYQRGGIPEGGVLYICIITDIDIDINIDIHISGHGHGLHLMVVESSMIITP